MFPGFVAFAGFVAFEGIDFLAVEAAIAIGVELAEVVALTEGDAEAVAFAAADVVAAIGIGEEEDFAWVVEGIREPAGMAVGGAEESHGEQGQVARQRGHMGNFAQLHYRQITVGDAVGGCAGSS